MLLAGEARAAALTHIGCVRRQNEDSVLLQVDDDTVLAVVADGMGGHAGGAVASHLAVDAYARCWDARQQGELHGGWLRDVARAANDSIRQQAVVDPALRQMGTTLVAALVMGSQLHLAHVGDSRCYRLRHGILDQLTRDHSVVQQMMDDGVLTAAQAERSPMRHYLARSLGSQPVVQIDSATLPVQAGDRLLLCSDGLSNMLPAADIAAILAAASDSDAACEHLLGEALARGATDNVSVIVLFV
jgi:serine/threonine protein phosphatase PrpC